MEKVKPIGIKDIVIYDCGPLEMEIVVKGIWIWENENRKSEPPQYETRMWIDKERFLKECFNGEIITTVLRITNKDYPEYRYQIAEMLLEVLMRANVITENCYKNKIEYLNQWKKMTSQVEMPKGFQTIKIDKIKS